MSRILITGGSGLLAVNWAIQSSKSHSVVLALHSRKISLLNIESVNINLESIDEVSQLMRDLSIQVVIHTAALTSVEACEANPLLARHTNAILAQNVSIASAMLGIKLVHISTDHLFDGAKSFENEFAPTRPLNVYASTKAEAEELVQRNCPGALIIRTNFYGYGTSYRKSFSDLILSSLIAKKHILLFKDVFYTPVLIDVLVDVVHKLISRDASGIFNVVGDERVSKYEFGLCIAKKFSLNQSLIRPILLSEATGLVVRPNDLSLSNKKVSDTLGCTIGVIDDHLSRLKLKNSSYYV